MTIIAFLLTLITTCNTLSSSPAFQAPQKYIETGSRYLQFTPSVLTQHSTGNNYYIFTISLSQAKLKPYNCHANIQGIDYQIPPQRQLSFSIYNITHNSNSSLQWRLSTSFPNNLLSLSLRYLIIVQPFTSLIYTYQIFGRNISLNRYQDKWRGKIVAFLHLRSTLPQQYSLFMNGIKVKLNNLEKFDIEFTSFCALGKNLIINIEFRHLQKPILSQIVFSAIIFDNEWFSNFYDFQYRVTSLTILSINSEATFYNNTEISMNDKNMFWGLSKLSLSNQSSFTFSIDFQNDQIKVGSRLSYNLIEIKAIVIQVRSCSQMTPYYLINNDSCYDQCPERYRINAIQNICQKCLLYDCLGCADANNLCSTCSPDNDFRELNTTTNRCDPLPGYYDDGNNNSITIPCNSNCYTCLQTPNNCTSCRFGYLLNGDSNICQRCPKYCQICTSRVVCTKCVRYFAVKNGQCVLHFNSSIESVNIVASATTTLFSLSALVTIFVFIKQKREWPTVEEKQEKYTDDKNGMERERKSSQWNLREETLRQLPSNKSIKQVPSETQFINLRTICETKLDEKQFIK